MTRAYSPLPSAAELRELFDFRPLTGELVARVSRGRCRAGTVLSGSPTAKGYRLIGIQGKLYYMHRIIYCWVHGVDPGALDIDHVDRNNQNNQSWNLRACSRTQNNFNRAAQGYVQMDGRYYARICTGNRRVKALGGYGTAEEAGAAYAKAAQELHGEFACTVGVGLPLAASTVNL